MNKYRRVVLLALLMSLRTFAQAAFEDTGWGARPVGMGGAFTAISDDANASLYNPAGLVQVQWHEVSAMYSRLFSGLDLYSGSQATGGDTVHLDQSFLAYASRPTDYGSFGISWANFNTTSLYREDTVSFSYANHLGRLIPALGKTLSMGANIKYLHRGYSLDAATVNDPVFADGDSRDGVSGDVGVLWKPEEGRLEGLRAGLALQNINEPDMGFLEKEKVPFETRLGLAYQSKQLPWLVPAFDVTRRNKVTGYHGGVESWMFNDTLGLRAGANRDEAAAGISYYQALGKRTGFRFDYGFTIPYFIEDTSGGHRLQLTIYF